MRNAAGYEIEDQWRGSCRLLFRATDPNIGTSTEYALVRYYMYVDDVPSALTHMWRAGGRGGGASGSGGACGSAAGAGRAAHAVPRADSSGRATGARRMRFVEPSRPQQPNGALDANDLLDMYTIVPLSTLLRVEHVLPDLQREGLGGGAHEAFYLNVWKWSLEPTAFGSSAANQHKAGADDGGIDGGSDED